MKYKPIILTVVGIVAAFLLIGFANINERIICKKVIITIDNQLDNYFIDNDDVLEIISNGYTEKIEGTSYADLEVRLLESRIKANSYVEDAEIYRDLKGNLLVNVLLRRPVARVVQENGPDAYLAEDGTILPISDKFSSRVVIISGVGTKKIVSLTNIQKSEFDELFNLIEYINADKFWKAQIAQVDIQKNEELVLLPQVTKQEIEFGDLSDYKNKFSRLAIFYKEILPRKGWNSYRTVNLKYKNQIICE